MAFGDMLGVDSGDSGSFTPESLKQRRRLAEAMLQTGMDISPIQSPWQGLARMANAGIGGYELGAAERAEKAEKAKTTQTLLGLLGDDKAAAPASAAPTATAAAGPSDFTAWLKQKEGFNPSAYGDFKQTSIGYGTRAQPGETSISPEEAEKRLGVELSKARQLVQGFGVKLSPKQEDALTDLTYNSGTKWMSEGLGAAVKSGNWPVARQLFEKYINAGGKPLPGLASRRKELSPWLLDTGGAPDVETPFGTVTAAGTTEAPAEAMPAALGGSPAAAAAAGQPAPSATGRPAAISPRPLPPETAAQIRTLLANPATQALGLQMLQEARKAAIPNYEFKSAGDNAFRFDPRTGQAEPITGASGGKAPPGFRWNQDHTQLEAIPGGPGEHISSEAAGRLAMMQTAMPGVEEARKVFLKSWGPKELLQSQFSGEHDPAFITGEIGRAQRSVRIAIEATLRVMTGAAAPESEVQRYEAMFMPTARDNIQSATQKMDALQSFMSNAQELSTRGRRPAEGSQPPGAKQPGAPAPKRVKYNPETGELE